MPKTQYKNLEESDNVETCIMLFVSWWVRTNKTPVPRKEIMIELTKEKTPRGTAEAALYRLIDKGYIRKAFTISNKTCYVQLRGV